MTKALLVHLIHPRQFRKLPSCKNITWNAVARAFPRCFVWRNFICIADYWCNDTVSHCNINIYIIIGIGIAYVLANNIYYILLAREGNGNGKTSNVMRLNNETCECLSNGSAKINIENIFNCFVRMCCLHSKFAQKAEKIRSSNSRFFRHHPLFHILQTKSR